MYHVFHRFVLAGVMDASQTVRSFMEAQSKAVLSVTSYANVIPSAGLQAAPTEEAEVSEQSWWVMSQSRAIWQDPVTVVPPYKMGFYHVADWVKLDAPHCAGQSGVALHSMINYIQAMHALQGRAAPVSKSD
jgi:hypothetical protein